MLIESISIKHPYTIGFAPYWLFSKLSPDYYKHINTLTYFGLTIDSDGSIKKYDNPQELEPGWNYLNNDNFKLQLNTVKKNGVKLSLLVHQADEDIISQIIANPVINAQKLMDDVKPVMEKFGFRDLNLDIESFREASPASQAAFLQFVGEVKNLINKNELGTVSIDISPSVFVKQFLVDPKNISLYVDHVIIMGYDYHYSGSYLAGPVSPLGGAPTIREYDLNSTILHALEKIPKEKLIIGLPLYGYEWETISPKPGAPAIPGGASTASIRRVSELLSNCNNCNIGYDQIAQSPYVIFNNSEQAYYHQIYYENQDSFRTKIDAVKKNQMSGIALWALGYEDPELLKIAGDYKNYIY